MYPRWTILIATVGERDDRFVALAKKLIKQAKPYKGDVQILVYWNNYEHHLSHIRQTLVDQASGKYISFIDDDDDVPDYFVDEVMTALERNPDYVGWQLQLYHDGAEMRPTYHSLRYQEWSEDDEGYYRNISHLNPIKKILAQKVKFENNDQEKVAEDVPWAERMAGIPKTEVYIDKIMYFYRHDPNDSVWRGKPSQKGRYKGPVFRNKYFKYVEDK